MKLYVLPLLFASVSAGGLKKNPYDSDAPVRELKSGSGKSKSGSGKSKSGSGKCGDFTGMYDIIESATHASFGGLGATDTGKLALTCFDNQHDWDNFEEFAILGPARRALTEVKGRKLLFFDDAFDESDVIEQICYFEAMGFPESKNGTAIHNYGYAIVGQFGPINVEFDGYDDEDELVEDLPEIEPYLNNCGFFTDFVTGDAGVYTEGIQLKNGVVAVFTEGNLGFYPYFAHKVSI